MRLTWHSLQTTSASSSIDTAVGVDVLVAALALEPHVIAVGAGPRVGVRALAEVGIGAHRLDPARAAPWRGDRSPLATL